MDWLLVDYTHSHLTNYLHKNILFEHDSTYNSSKLTKSLKPDGTSVIRLWFNSLEQKSQIKHKIYFTLIHVCHTSFPIMISNNRPQKILPRFAMPVIF